MPFLAEAMRALEEGLGTAEDIDTGARVGLNHPMGPLELADFIGLDVCLGIMRVLDDGLGGDALRARRTVLRELVDGRPPRPEDRPGLLHLPARADAPDGRADDRRPDRRGAAAPGDRPRVRHARGRARPRSSATRPSATTARSSTGWASSA